MKTIYRVQTGNEDCTRYSDGIFFLDKEDAEAECLTSKGEKDNWKQLSEVTAYEKGEYNPDNIKRVAALKKLTDEEKTLLGLA